MLRANSISVSMGGRLLLDNFSVDFHPGELAMVVGPNGAGKTTLLRCLDGELSPSGGGVELAGRAVQAWRRADLARHRAVLPQQSTLNFPFSGRDVALMGRMPHATTAAENHAIATRALGLCDCAHLAERAYTSLSGGEQQRVQTARALAQIIAPGAAPRFLLLDEPVSALDLSHQYALLKTLKRLAVDDRLGVVCTLHNLNLAAQFADRAIIMERGLLVADGAPGEVFTEETISQVFDLEVSVQRHPDNPAIPLLIPKLSG